MNSPSPNVTYGYLRIGEVAGEPNSLLFSGLVMNVDFPTQQFTLTFAFTGAESYTTSPFTLPQGSAAAFSFLIGVPFAGAHSGTLTLAGSSSTDTTTFQSDPSTSDLGFQLSIVGHAMPAPPPGDLPCTYFSVTTL